MTYRGQDISDLGGPTWPLRPSSLGMLITCPRQWIENVIAEKIGMGNSGKAADTGSAVHKAVATWHQTRDVQSSIKAMHDHRHLYPQADLDDALLSFRPYAADPRNACTPTKVEAEVRGMYEDVYFAGTCDQVREEHGRHYVWDVKSGKEDPWTYAPLHAYQMAAYVIAAEQTFGWDVEPGGFILTYSYRRKCVKRNPSPSGVFVPSGLDRPDCNLLIKQVSQQLSQLKYVISRDDVRTLSRFGPHCGYCDLSGFRCIKGVS